MRLIKHNFPFIPPHCGVYIAQSRGTFPDPPAQTLFDLLKHRDFALSLPIETCSRDAVPPNRGNVRNTHVLGQYLDRSTQRTKSNARQNVPQCATIQPKVPTYRLQYTAYRHQHTTNRLHSCETGSLLRERRRARAVGRRDACLFIPHSSWPCRKTCFPRECARILVSPLCDNCRARSGSSLPFRCCPRPQWALSRHLPPAKRWPLRAP